MPKAKQPNGKQGSFDATLWQTADKLRKNIDAGEYKHIVLGLIFLKYISDAFEVLHSKLVDGKGEYAGADPEDPNEYTAGKAFFVPPIARWKPISDNAKKTEIILDNNNILYCVTSIAPTEFLSIFTSVGRPQPVFTWPPT